MPKEAHDNDYLQDMKRTLSQYKALGDKAFAQIAGDEIHWKVEPESNSIATIVMHVSGNLLSRWTDFLTTDGEKPWRNRDAEFEDASFGKEEMLALWEKGWKCVLDAVESMREEMLPLTITIRGEKYTVLRALNRSVTHTAYHVGQIVFIAKALRSAAWTSLSVPKGKSKEFNAAMGLKQAPPKP
jgi:hypothetical protein